MNEGKIALASVGSVSELADKIYNDMAGFGIIEQYLFDEEVEEININSYQNIIVQYPNRRIRLKETFFDAEECTTIVKKMARSGGVILDGSKPLGDSYITKGIRMSGSIPPCISDDIGGIASIRKQKKAFITRKKLVDWGTAIEEQLDFFTLCINNGISIAVSGETGAGKTSDMAYILETVKNDTRIVSIEDTSELDLTKLNDDGIVINDVVQMYTKEEPNAISMNELLKLSLRLHPEVIVPAEMRGAEANTVCESGRTGHTILTSLHANSALTAYDRILTMIQMSDTTLSEERILTNIVEALPIMVQKRRLKDGSRKYTEIFEATGVENGKVVGNMLYKYKVTSLERDDTGLITKINGTHQKVGELSIKLAQKLFDNGVSVEIIKKYCSNFEK